MGGSEIDPTPAAAQFKLNVPVIYPGYGNRPRRMRFNKHFTYRRTSVILKPYKQRVVYIFIKMSNTEDDGLGGERSIYFN